jgi:hypothetical protein
MGPKVSGVGMSGAEITTGEANPRIMDWIYGTQYRSVHNASIWRTNMQNLSSLCLMT